MKKLIFLCFIAFSAFNQSFGQSQFGITVFGTEAVTAADIRKKYGSELNALVKLYDTNKADYKSQRDKLNAELVRLGSFAYANLQLFKSFVGEYDFIIDLVEEKDKGDRLNYREIKSEALSDPDNLINRWIKYESLSFQLFDNGEITDMDCPVIHCIWSFNHPDLAPYLELFNQKVPENKTALIEILNKSQSTVYRAVAAFLLAHANLQPQALLDVLLPSIADPESQVRNNSMRVIYYIVKAYPESRLDIDNIITTLNYPSFTDRNKALVILRSIPSTRFTTENVQRMTPILLEILEKKDAHNFRNAHTVLKNISHLEYSSDDIDSWKKWFAN